MKTLRSFALLPAFLALAGTARAQGCPFVPGGPEVHYLGHDERTGDARLRVFVPSAPAGEDGGFLVLARDLLSRAAQIWWMSRVPVAVGDLPAVPGDVPAGERPSVDREAPIALFPSGQVLVELWVDPGGGAAPYLCGATGPIVLPPYGPGIRHYGPIHHGANVVTLMAERVPDLGPGPALLQLATSGAPPRAGGFLLVSLSYTDRSLLGGALLVDPDALLAAVPLPADREGRSLVLVSDFPDIDPIFFFQAVFLDPEQAGGLAFSNGVALPL